MSDEFDDAEFDDAEHKDDELDKALVAAWQARGDKQAANRLLKRHLPRLRLYFCNKIASRADQEELLAQTLKGLVEAIPGFRGESSFRTFLFKLARNKLYDHFRARSRKPDAVDIEELSVIDLSPGPSTIRSRNRREALLLAGLRAIPLGDQELLELRYWEKLTVPRIAEILGIPAAAVKSRLRRAQERLRKTMEGLAESGEELEHVRTGEIDRWADEVHKNHFAPGHGVDSGDEVIDEEDGEDGDER